MSDQAVNTDTLSLTADIVAAHVANNSVHAADLPKLISTVHAALAGLGGNPGATEQDTSERPSKQAIRKSITSDGLVSFLDGKTYSVLRRHLTTHGHTPESYREKFGLPVDYPLVSAKYAKKRRDFAKAIGLGRRKVEDAVDTVAATVKAPAKRARKAVAAVADTVEEAVTPTKGGRKSKLSDAIASAKEHLTGEG